MYGYPYGDVDYSETGWWDDDGNYHLYEDEDEEEEDDDEEEDATDYMDWADMDAMRED